jgi:hypothetical protein
MAFAHEANMRTVITVILNGLCWGLLIGGTVLGRPGSATAG